MTDSTGPQHRRVSRRAFAFLAIWPALVGIADAQEQLHEWRGEIAGDLFGTAVADAGDVDGDGIDDVVAVSVNDVVRVFSGASGAQILRWDEPSWTTRGSISGLAAAGDLDGDGHGDLLIGLPQYVRASFTGIVLAVSGADGAVLWTREAEDVEQYLGMSVLSLGDIDGDAIDDCAATALYSDDQHHPGYVILLSGATGLELNRWTRPDYTGGTLDPIGDVDGDSIPDVLAGTNGTVVVLSGADATLIREVALPATWQKGVTAFCTIGDVDGDGWRDLALGYAYADVPGLPHDDNTGALAVLSLATGVELWTRLGDVDDAHLGGSMADAGDVDGDGSPDFLAGATHLKDQPYALLVRATDGAVLWRFDGAARSNFGANLASLGDVNGDKHRELVISADRVNGPGANAGAVYLHSGNDLFLSITPTPAHDGDLVAAVTTLGPPGALVALVLVEVNGTPRADLIGDFATFDATSRYVVSDTVPPGLAGMQWILTAYGDDANGRLRVSNRGTLDFQ